ncbi:MAG: glucokinase [Gemmatimonadota bacterium]|nr:glucokinase [Gemmatimonadota bacterium]
MLLVGDIGATHARLALISPEHGVARPAREAVLPSQRYDSFETLLAAFLKPPPLLPIERAVFAVAGPVVHGRAELTNIGWVVDEAQLGAALGIPAVRLLNDLVALAYAVPRLTSDALRTLQRGEPVERGTIAVVAPGTGLGEAFLTWERADYRAHPSEAGHADFAPTDALQEELLTWLRRRFDHVSYERVCSGSGLPNLYDFLKERGTAPEEPWLADRLAAADDCSPVIVDAAFDARTPSALALAALELFATILAAEAGNAALRVLATGGVYLGGGMPRRILPLLERESSIERFRQKDRMTDLLALIPLHVIVARGVALRGAACVALAER